MAEEKDLMGGENHSKHEQLVPSPLNHIGPNVISRDETMFVLRDSESHGQLAHVLFYCAHFPPFIFLSSCGTLVNLVIPWASFIILGQLI